jgi:hypothetical protein
MLRLDSQTRKSKPMKALSLITVLALFSAAFAGCGRNNNKKIEITPSAKTTENGQPQGLTLNFNNPVIINSTNYVMYPLPINKETRGGYSIISNSNGSQVYWNIVFYDMVAKTYHLLDKRKMVITGYSTHNGSADANDGSGNVDTNDDHIFYSVIVDDRNKDGNLDLEDPAYLFISDKKGNNFTQISPKAMHVFNWSVIKPANKILINIAGDTNNDNKFDNEDNTTPYVYDFTTGGIAQPVLDKNFIDTAGKLFTKHWQVKKQNQ